MSSYEYYIIQHGVFQFVLNFFIDLICVSIHHSSRYGNSESYMLNEVDDDHLMNKSCSLKTTKMITQPSKNFRII